MSEPTQPTSLGIKETREAVKCGLAILVAGAKFSQHKTSEAYAAVYAVVTTLPAAIENVGEVPAEFKDIDPSELELIVGDVREQLPNILPEKALKVANIALVIGLNIAKGILELKAE